VTALLTVLAAAGKSGLTSGALAAELKLANPKGLSAHVQAAQKAIKEKATGRPDSYLVRKRTRDGTTWHVKAEKLKEIGLLWESPG
jgi:hypothetical protein